MKVTASLVLVAVSTLASIAKTNGQSLRAAATPKTQEMVFDGVFPTLREEKGDDEGEDLHFQGITVFMEHVQYSDDDDEDVISDAIVEAYNAVHKDYTIEKSFVTNEIQVPEDDEDEEVSLLEKELVSDGFLGGKSRRRRYHYSVYFSESKWTCTLCGGSSRRGRGRNRLPPLALVSLKNPDVHEQFVDKFCNIVKTSGKKAFADVKSCAIDLTYTSAEEALDALDKFVELKKTVPDAALGWGHHEKLADYDVHLGGNLQCSHVEGGENGATITTDVGVIGKAVIEAYNEAHSDTHFSMTNFNLDRMFEIPESEDADDEDEDPDDEEGGPDDPTLGGKRRKYKYHYSVSFFHSDFRCTLCRSRSRRFPPGTMMFFSRGTHLAFEKLVAHKLRTSGLREYKHIHDCTLSFSYNSNPLGPDDMAEELGVVELYGPGALAQEE